MYAGVSGASVVELKAELYRAQQDAKLAREGLLDPGVKDRKQAGIDVSDILERRNAGIEARQAADQLAYKVAQFVRQELFGIQNLLLSRRAIACRLIKTDCKTPTQL